MAVKLWLDDTRREPDGWTRAYNMADAVRFSTDNDIEEMSLDHDLGPMPICRNCESSQILTNRRDPLRCDDGMEMCRCDCHRKLQPTGYDFVKWMMETDRWPTLKPVVHSANPVGAANMRANIDRYWFNPRLH